MIFQIISDVLDSNVILFFSIAISSYFLFQIALKCVESPYQGRHWLILLFCILNGFLISIGEELLDFEESYIFIDIYWIWLAFGILIFIEFFFLTKESLYVRIFLLNGMLTLLIVCDSLTLFLLDLFNLKHNFNSGGCTLTKESLNLSLAISFILLIGILKNYVFKTQDLKTLIHSKTRGRFLFLILILFNVLSILMGYILHHYIHLEFGKSSSFFFILSFLSTKDVLIFLLLIFIIHAHLSIGSAHFREERLLSDIQRNRYAQNAMHSNALYEFIVNLTTNSFITGQEFFITKDGQKLSYFKAMSYLLTYCVHPNDAKQLEQQKLNEIETYRHQMALATSFHSTIRLSSEKLLEHMKSPDLITERLKKIKSEYFYISYVYFIIEHEETGDLLLYGSFQNIDKEVREKQNLLQTAYHDSLTGLLNRSAFEKEIQAALLNQKEGVLFLLDRDNFKAINDSFGHPIGDVLLKETSHIILREFRVNDIIGRLGGDEFIVFAFGLKDKNKIVEKAKILIEKLRKDFYKDQSTISSTISIGIALVPNDGRDYQTLYKNADTALYQAKRKGKNTFEFYQDPQKTLDL